LNVGGLVEVMLLSTGILSLVMIWRLILCFVRVIMRRRRVSGGVLLALWRGSGRRGRPGGGVNDPRCSGRFFEPVLMKYVIRLRSPLLRGACVSDELSRWSKFPENWDIFDSPTDAEVLSDAIPWPTEIIPLGAALWCREQYEQP